MSDILTIPPPRRGRPRLSTIPAHRRLHIGAAFCRFVLRESPEVIAARYGVSARTLMVWTNRALTYQDVEAAILRRTVEVLDGNGNGAAGGLT